MGAAMKWRGTLRGMPGVMRQYGHLSGSCITLDHGYKRPYGYGTLERRNGPLGSRVALEEACQEAEGPCERFQEAMGAVVELLGGLAVLVSSAVIIT